MNTAAFATAYLIDDDSITLELMGGIIEPIGVTPLCFNSAEAFLSAYSPRPCECVISDMRMPGVSAWRAADGRRCGNSCRAVVAGFWGGAWALLRTFTTTKAGLIFRAT